MPNVYSIIEGPQSRPFFLPDFLYANQKMKDRLIAFSIHLAISAVVALFVMLLVFKLWYPAPMHQLIGVEKIFFLIIGIDVIIGPVLTFIVFKRDKPSLKFDLSVIALLQISAFIYGIWTVSLGRPAWVVFNVDRFDLVQVLELDTKSRENTPPAYREAPWFGPKWVYAKAPDDVEERNTLTLESVFAGVDLPQRPDLYQPFSNAKDQIREHAIGLEELKRFNPATEVEQLKQRWPEADAYLPLMHRVSSATVLIERETTRIIGISPLQPW